MLRRFLLLASVCTASALCPVLVKYEATLSQATADVGDTAPPFSGTVSIFSNNATISSWKLGWNFTQGEALRQQQDIFTRNVNAITLSGSTVQLQSFGNNTVLPFNWTGVNFLAYRSTDVDPAHPYGVAAISGVAFNNLLCSKLPFAQENITSTTRAVESRDTLSVPSPLIVEITNVKEDLQAVNLAGVNLQYWFNGPSNVPDTQDALSIFAFSCLDASASLGCDKLTWNITQGLPSVQGARFVLNIGFIDDSGMLLSSANGSSSANRTVNAQISKALSVVELLLQINSTQPFITSMNSDLDFSYLETERTDAPITNTTTIIPRQAEPNVKLPAYLGGDLAWGGQPISGGQLTTPSPSPAPAPAPSALPPGVTCVSTVPAGASGLAGTGSNALQVCGLFASYCCYGENNEGVDTSIPEGSWPPPSFPIPPEILEDSPPSQQAIAPSSQGSGSVPAQKDSSAISPATVAPRIGPAVEPGSVGTYETQGGSSPASKKRSSEGAIIGGSIGGITAVLVCLSVAAFLVLRQRRRAHSNQIKSQASAYSLTLDSVSPRVTEFSGLDKEESGSSPSPGGRISAFSFPSQLGRQETKSSNEDPLISIEDAELGSAEPFTWPIDTPASHTETEAGGSKSLLHDSGLYPDKDMSSYNLPRMARLPSTPGLLRSGSNLETHLERTQTPDWHCLPLEPETLVKASRSMPVLYSGSEDTLSSLLQIKDGAESQKILVKTWSGVVIQGLGLVASARKSEVEQKRGRHFRNKLSVLPPLKSLPPPISLSDPVSSNIDLRVNFESEIKPFLGHCLGSGGYGSVYEGLWRGKRVAVKCLPKDGATSAQYEALIREIELSAKFNSRRLVQVYGACLQSSATICLIMELVEGGNLHQLIHHSKGQRMSLTYALQVVNDVAAGLAYMHPNIIHSDLKPQNILIDTEGRAKIADFGISRVKDPAKTFLTATHTGGTPVYMAPEQFNGSYLDEKVDVYALGCILNECLTRRRPWDSAPNFYQIIVQVAIKGQRPPMDPSCPDSVRRLISKCWSQDSRSRPSCAEIMRMTDIFLQRERRKGSHRVSSISN